MGEYWVTYTADGDYKDIFNMAGNTFVTFLQNLNTLHTRVGAIMPNLNPPSFTCTDIGKNSLRLHYYSTRVGLSSMVIGLLKGLGNRFKMVVEVKQTAFKVQGDDHDEFLVKFYPTNPN